MKPLNRSARRHLLECVCIALALALSVASLVLDCAAARLNAEIDARAEERVSP